MYLLSALAVTWIAVKTAEVIAGHEVLIQFIYPCKQVVGNEV